MKKIGYWAGCLAALCGGVAFGESLDGIWRLDYRDEEAKGEWKSVPATVPGDTYLALQEAGVVPDLTKGTNVWSMFGYEQCEWGTSRVRPQWWGRSGGVCCGGLVMVDPSVRRLRRPVAAEPVR